MIDMTMRNNDCIDSRCDMCHPFLDPLPVRLNCRVECNLGKIESRKVGIDKKRVIAGAKLEPVRAEISHTDTIARCGCPIGYNEIRIFIESCAEQLRRADQKQTRGPHS